MTLKKKKKPFKKNIVEKGDNAGCSHLLPFQQCFYLSREDSSQITLYHTIPTFNDSEK